MFKVQICMVPEAYAGVWTCKEAKRSCWLPPAHSPPLLNHDFHRAKADYFDEAPIFFYFTSCSFVVMFKNSLPNLGHSSFLLKVLEFYNLYLDLLSF